jgi:hypothetical protein
MRIVDIRGRQKVGFWLLAIFIGFCCGGLVAGVTFVFMISVSPQQTPAKLIVPSILILLGILIAVKIFKGRFYPFLNVNFTISEDKITINNMELAPVKVSFQEASLSKEYRLNVRTQQPGGSFYLVRSYRVFKEDEIPPADKKELEIPFDKDTLLCKRPSGSNRIQFMGCKLSLGKKNLWIAWADQRDVILFSESPFREQPLDLMMRFVWMKLRRVAKRV